MFLAFVLFVVYALLVYCIFGVAMGVIILVLIKMAVRRRGGNEHAPLTTYLRFLYCTAINWPFIAVALIVMAGTRRT